jgi:hypothetical protein
MDPDPFHQLLLEQMGMERIEDQRRVFVLPAPGQIDLVSQLEPI